MAKSVSTKVYAFGALNNILNEFRLAFYRYSLNHLNGVYIVGYSLPGVDLPYCWWPRDLRSHWICF